MFYNESADSGTYESESFEPFPDNTLLVCCIDRAKTVYDDNDDEEYIELRWHVLEGEHINRRLFQKLRVNSRDEDRKNRANRMMLAVDFNCGRYLSRLGKYPSDRELEGALFNKPMRVAVGVWEQDGKKGNWIKSVYGMDDSPRQKQRDGEPF